MPVQNSLSWAERIQTANETKAKFEPVPLGHHNFFIKQADVVQGPKGEYIKYRAAISDGPRANALVFEQCYPNAEKIGYFLEFWHALGFTDEWFMTGNGPTTDQIAAAILNRPFSAEVYVRDDAKDDKNGDKYRSLRKFVPFTGSTAEPAQAAPANTFGAPAAAPAPAAPAAVAPVATAPVATTAGGSPWGAPVATPSAVPEPTAPSPAASAPAVDPWSGTPAAAPAASGTSAPPNPFA